jgi:hypothetical protein
MTVRRASRCASVGPSGIHAVLVASSSRQRVAGIAQPNVCSKAWCVSTAGVASE